jgi:site-specific DNA-methyltransferase (adenine-specific)
VKPYFASEDVTLYLGDMREVLPSLKLDVDCAIVDPPYGETSLQWDRWPDGWPGLVADVASSMWCFGSMRMFLKRSSELERYWNLSQDVVWEKQNGTGLAADRFRRIHEYALHWYRGAWNLIHHDMPREANFGPNQGARLKGVSKGAHLGDADRRVWADDGTRLMRSIIKAPNLWRRGAIHPTEKPIALLDPLIRYACPPGGVVLDPFAGSGSTAAAARLSGRRTVLIEADEKYCEATARRLQQELLPFPDADLVTTPDARLLGERHEEGL